MATEPRVSSGRLAEVLGITGRRVGQLVAEGIIPASRSGQYDLGSCCQGYIRFLRAVPRDRSLAEVRKLLLQEKAAIVKLQRQELEGSLVRIADLKRGLEVAYGAMRNRLLAIPSKLTPRLALLSDPAKIFKLLTDAIFEALSEISNYRFTEEESPSSRPEAAE